VGKPTGFNLKETDMKKYILQLLSVAILAPAASYAGNPDRAGGAGATQLLINPYARSGALFGSNTASVRGVEAMHFNIGGLAYTQKTELFLSNVNYLQGTDVFIRNFGMAQNLGGGNVMGISVNSFDFGNLPITTESQPDATLGTFSPQVLNIGLAYSKMFSNSITGGITLRIISEGISNARASGVGLDAGVQYQTTLIKGKKDIKKEDFRFGIAVRNIGPNMKYTGSGLSFRAIVPASGADRRAYMGSESFNLPALVNIGVSYDMRLDKKGSESYNHKLTGHGNFNYNSFSANIISLGLEYAFKNTAMARFGYMYQEDIHNTADYRTQYIGITGGFGFALPVTKTGDKLLIDYAYTPTRVFNGIHTVTLAYILASK
jgi:hypothetical protein